MARIAPIDVESSTGQSRELLDTETRGQVDAADLEAVRRAGFDDGAIAEVVANVAESVLTNDFNLVARTDVDFPAAPALEPEPAVTA